MQGGFPGNQETTKATPLLWVMNMKPPVLEITVSIGHFLVKFPVCVTSAVYLTMPDQSLFQLQPTSATQRSHTAAVANSLYCYKYAHTHAHPAHFCGLQFCKRVYTTKSTYTVTANVVSCSTTHCVCAHTSATCMQWRSQDFEKGVSIKIAHLRAAKILKPRPQISQIRAFYAYSTCAYCAVPNIRYSNTVITITSIVDVSVRL